MYVYTYTFETDRMYRHSVYISSKHEHLSRAVQFIQYHVFNLSLSYSVNIVSVVFRITARRRLISPNADVFIPKVYTYGEMISHSRKRNIRQI